MTYMVFEGSIKYGLGAFGYYALVIRLQRQLHALHLIYEINKHIETFHVVGYNIIVLMNTVQTFLVDLVPNQSSSITACVSSYDT